MENSSIKISVLTPSIRAKYLGITYDSLKNQTFKGFEWLIDVDMPSDKFLLPKAMNRLLKRAKGDIIVILQDCISVPENFLQHIYDTYTGDFVTYPISKEGSFDWRKNNNNEVQPQEWESDLASAPRKAFFEIGGYDEDYCNGWSWDNVEVAYRANYLKYKFRCDNAVWGEAIDHDKLEEHPFRGKLKNNDARARDTKTLADIGDIYRDYL